MKNLALVLAVLFVLAIPVFAVEAVSVGYTVADAKVRPGSQTNIQLTVSNPGTTSTPSYITLFMSPGPYLTVDPSTLSIASLGLGSSQLTNLKVSVDRNAISTTSYITVKATYVVDGTSRDTSVTIPIKIRRDPVLQIENVTYSRQPEPGISTMMSFYITNTGVGPATDLRVSLNQSSAISVTGSSGDLYVAQLDPSGKTFVEFPITISPTADAGLVNLPVALSYYDESKSDQTTVTKYVGIAVGGKTDFIATVDSVKDFYFGQHGTASISIANAGNSPAEFLTVKASSPYGSKEVYVGKLDSDDTQTIDVPQYLSGAFGPYNMTLELDWKDNFGNEYADVQEVELTPESAPIQIGIGTIVVLLVLAGIAWWYRKRIIAAVKGLKK